MRTVILRIAATLGISEGAAFLLVAVFIVAMEVVIAAAIATRGLLPTIGVIGALLVLLVSFRWPLLPLFAFAFFIPIEELILIGGLGTVSRYAGIIFIVAYGLPRLGRLRLVTMPIPGWAYLGWAILSVGWALHPEAALAELAVLILLFAVGVLIAVVVAERPTIVRPLLWTYSLSASLTAIVGISIFVTGGSSSDARVAALPGQSPAYYAALLLPALAFSLHQLIEHRATIMSTAVATVCLIGIVVSGTRGAWVSAAAIVLLFVLPRLSWSRRVLTFGAIAVLLIGSLQLPGAASLVHRAEIAVSSGGAGRTDIWTVGLTIFEAAPVAGVGLANFPVAYTPELVRESDVGVYSANNPASRAPHSIIVGTLGELGMIGFLLLASFLLPLLLTRGWGPDARAVQAALVSLMVSALFLDVLSRKQVWLLVGIGCGLAYLARTQQGQAVLGAVDRGGAPLRRLTRRTAVSGSMEGRMPVSEPNATVR